MEALILSRARSAPLVNVSRLNVPEKLASPSPLNRPEGKVELKLAVPTDVAFSNAASVSVLVPPALAKLNEMPVRFEEKEIVRGPDSVEGPQ